ncbi:MAG: M20/M25/M40 family metallo-hydrolase [Oscillospiraceae bacterium]|jgi:endoglucanase|nr:M20/M25/M40 family metallo-hydrolase [Oscillospiraceae bacterium]
MIELLKRLALANGPSGAEDDVREIIKTEAGPYADEIIEDAMGNLIVLRKGKSTSKKKPLMFAAHSDEVGIIITESVGGGFYKFDFLGGVDTRVALGKPIKIGAVSGVISPGKAWHLSTEAERKRLPKVTELFLDCFGNESLNPGDSGTFISSFEMFGDGYVKAKALDDRAGCAVLLTLMKRDYGRDIYYAFTAQEEVGTRGSAAVAARGLSDTVIVVETTTAADYPDRDGGEKICKPGGGAVVPFMDAGSIFNRALWQQITALADEAGIKWQTKTRVAGGTDARSFQQRGFGAKVCAISLPVRNLHSPSCIAKLEDLDSVLQLCEAVIRRLPSFDD